MRSYFTIISVKAIAMRVPLCFNQKSSSYTAHAQPLSTHYTGNDSE